MSPAANAPASPPQAWPGGLLLLLIGGGQMGSAMLRGWLAAPPGAAGAVARVWVVEPNLAALRARLGDPPDPRVTLLETATSLDQPADVVVLAVKPQVMDAVAAGLGSQMVGWQPRPLVISVAAGKAIAGFEAAFGADTPIIRVMPNLPAAIGQGMSVACANAAAGEADRARAAALMTAVGDVAFVQDEDLMHAVTAVSGSGPAYLFHLVEAMAAAGAAAGLAPDLAMRLARQTVTGAAALVARGEATPADLRRSVSSPGGTTLAALNVLMGGDPAALDAAAASGAAPAAGSLSDLMTRAIAAAAQRSRDLA